MKPCGRGGKTRENHSLSNLNKSFLNRGIEELSGVRHSDLFHHVGPVCLNGFHADFESLSNFFILQT